MDIENVDAAIEDYLKTHVYYGLKNLNTGFEVQSINYFSEAVPQPFIFFKPSCPQVEKRSCAAANPHHPFQPRKTHIHPPSLPNSNPPFYFVPVNQNRRTCQNLSIVRHFTGASYTNAKRMRF